MRSRAAYKLAELDEKYQLLKPGMIVVDLGAAPGGWTQIAVEKVNALGAKAGARGMVVGIDLTPVEAIAGATLLTQDFLAEEAPDMLKAILASGPSGKASADVVLSDMAATTTGPATGTAIRLASSPTTDTLPKPTASTGAVASPAPADCATRSAMR